MKKSFFHYSLALTALILAQNALAYLPPSSYLVRQLARKHADLKSISIKSRLTFFDGSAPKSNPLHETLTVSDDGKITIVIKSQEGHSVATATKILTTASIGNGTLLYGLSLLSESAAVFATMKAAGLPVITEAQLYAEKHPSREDLPYKPEEAVSLGRMDHRVLLALSSEGARSEEPPLLWIDKGSFLPVRAVTKADSGETLDLKFNQHSVYQSSFYPKTVEVSRDGKLWVRIDLVEIKAAKSSGSINMVNKITAEAASLTADLEAYMKWLR